jgi:hypothetical protein
VARRVHRRQGYDKSVLSLSLSAFPIETTTVVKGFVRGSPTGLINLLTVLERNAKQLRHVNNDACMLHYEALHCYKILIRVKLRDVLGTTGSSAALP